MHTEQKSTFVRPARSLLATRIFHWIDQRTGLDKFMKIVLDEPIPGGARFAYVFGSGLLFIFILQIATGLFLTLYYVPSAETAHTSVAYITKKVAAGAFLRGLHSYGSSAMIIVLVLHFLQTFLYGSFKGRRELLWFSGAMLSLLVLAMGFTGYLLPWDQKAYFATAVGTNIVGQVPWIGGWLTRLVRGGDTIGTLTLSRFYVAHVLIIPGLIFLLVAGHILLFRKAGAAGPVDEDPVHPRLAAETFYPRQVLMDMAFALLLMVILGLLAYFRPATIGPVADPSDTHFLPRPDWYYLPMLEWLKLWEGPKVFLAVIVTPGVLALLFFLLPFLDRRLERRPWRRPIPVLAVAVVLGGAILLGFRSRYDDEHDPMIAAQLALQARQEAAYTKAPFQPYMEPPAASAEIGTPEGHVRPSSGPELLAATASKEAAPASINNSRRSAHPRATAPAQSRTSVAAGAQIFQQRGCWGCHGQAGQGGFAPALAPLVAQLSDTELAHILVHLKPQMEAGGMPPFTGTSAQLDDLIAFLRSLPPPQQSPAQSQNPSANATAR